jgi:hypothetical protein
MCVFVEHPRKKINSEVSIKYLRCAREPGEYSWGLNVQEDFFLRFLRVRYEGLRSMIVTKCIVLRL